MSSVTLDAGAPETTLERERRQRPRVAALAVASGVLLMAAAIIQTVGPHTNVSEATVRSTASLMALSAHANR